VLPRETGLLVPSEDAAALAVAIRQLLGDDALRRRLGARGRELVLSRFTASHMTRSFERLYDEICAERARINLHFAVPAPVR
jgi:glycosyltransferase involved in cell wall biosynthesis